MLSFQSNYTMVPWWLQHGSNTVSTLAWSSPLTLFQDTPSPGLYHVRDFIEEAELNPVRQTYGFKGLGRKAKTLGVRKGDLLLPGAYEYTDATQEVLMHQASYSFKNCPRPDIITLGIRDKVSFRHDLYPSCCWHMGHMYGIVQYKGGNTYLLSFRKLDEKIDSTAIFMH